MGLMTETWGCGGGGVSGCLNGKRALRLVVKVSIKKETERLQKGKKRRVRGEGKQMAVVMVTN